MKGTDGHRGRPHKEAVYPADAVVVRIRNSRVGTAGKTTTTYALPTHLPPTGGLVQTPVSLSVSQNHADFFDQVLMI